MAEVTMNVRLIAHTQLSNSFFTDLCESKIDLDVLRDYGISLPGAAVALTAIRTCYSHLRPTEILPTEGAKYFGSAASDGGAGTDADRLFRHIVSSKHTSTVEHLTFTFAIENISRALLAQLTRHRHMSFSVQSQRYVRLGSDDKAQGFDYVVPESVKNCEKRISIFDDFSHSAEDYFNDAMRMAQDVYDALRAAGVPPEDARAVLPNAAATNLVLTANLRTLLDFYAKRRKGRGAQSEICDLAERLREEVVAVEPWTSQFFEGA